MSTVLMVVSARGGSKSVPRKNLAMVAGRPLMWWTIDAAKRLKGTRRVIVSTDDEEIAQAARDMGAEVPFMRPPELAKDDTPGVVPIVHAARWLEEHEGYRADYVIHLQPTCPLRAPSDIEYAIALAERSGADAVVSVVPVGHHPYWMKTLDSQGRIQDFVPQEQPTLYRQALPQLYSLNGAIYLARHEVLLEDESFYKRDTHAYVMPPDRSLDIDGSWDLHLADLILKERRHVGHHTHW